MSRSTSTAGVVNETDYKASMNAVDHSTITQGLRTVYNKKFPNTRLVYRYEIVSQYRISGDIIKIQPTSAKVIAVLEDDLKLMNESYQVGLERQFLSPFEAKFQFDGSNKIAYKHRDVRKINYCNRIKMSSL